MDGVVQPLEDDRGVDIAQLRELLALTPAERVERLIQRVATWQEIRSHTDPGPASR